MDPRTKKSNMQAAVQVVDRATTMERIAARNAQEILDSNYALEMQALLEEEERERNYIMRDPCADAPPEELYRDVVNFERSLKKWLI
jgi:hypothetical protein